MSHFHVYEPTLASAAIDGALTAFVCFALLAGLLRLGRWVVSLFESETAHEDEEDGL